MMTKKDFDKIATIIYRLPDMVKIEAVEIANKVLESEPKFDRVKFSFMAGVTPCVKCDAVFSSSQDLASHMGRDHKEEV